MFQKALVISPGGKKLYERSEDIKKFAHKLCLFNMTHIGH